MHFTVAAGDASLAVWESGDPAGPPVVLVHGYPDTHAVWDGVALALAPAHRVITYDVRGAGLSRAPARTAAFRLERLAADLAAVLDARVPDRPAHVVGHDWGSIQLWEAVCHARLRGRIASFTSISGPCLDHAGAWLRAEPRRFTGQLLRSWYIVAFQLPLLAPLAWRAGLGRAWPRLLARLEGAQAPRVPTRAADGARGVALYRANVRERVRRPRPRATDVPVQLVVPTRDPFVSPALLAESERHAAHLTRREIDAGHWMPLTHPGWLAEAIAGHVARVEPL